ncbi:MAG: UbiA family prenyltransferase [Candidatus Hodarchaeota archaeon]
MWSILELIRAPHPVMAAIAAVTGAIVSARLMHVAIHVPAALIAIWIPALIVSSSHAINDYFDINVDIKNERFDRPLARGALRPKIVRNLSICGFLSGVILCALLDLFLYHLGGILTLICALLSLLSFSYSAGLKKHGTVGNLIVAQSYASPYLLGAYVLIAITNSHPSETVIATISCLGFMAFFLGWGREIIKDIQDIEGDIAQTLPRKVGKKVAAQISVLLLSFALLLSPLPLLLAFKNNLAYLIFGMFMDIAIIYLGYIMLKSQDVTTARRGRMLSRNIVVIGCITFLFASLTQGGSLEFSF